GKSDRRVRGAAGANDQGEYRPGSEPVFRAVLRNCGLQRRPFRMLYMFEKSSVQTRKGRSWAITVPSFTSSGCAAAASLLMMSDHEQEKQRKSSSSGSQW